MIMCVLCYPVSIRIYYQQGVLFLVTTTITEVLLFSKVENKDILQAYLCLFQVSMVGSKLKSFTPLNKMPIWYIHVKFTLS